MASINKFFLLSDSLACAWIQLSEALVSPVLGTVAQAGSSVLVGHVVPGRKQKDWRRLMAGMKAVAAHSAFLRDVRWQRSVAFMQASLFALVPCEDRKSVSVALSAGGLPVAEAEVEAHSDDSERTAPVPYATDMLSVIVSRPRRSAAPAVVQSTATCNEEVLCNVVPGWSQPQRFQLGSPIVTLNRKCVGFGTKVCGGGIRVHLLRSALQGGLTVLP
jgi:hypothetical protein